MKKIKILLADMTHNYRVIANPIIPYGIGLIASYALKRFGDRIDIRLFKYPDKLFEAINNDDYDVLACSTYVWNKNLSHFACELAKSKKDNVITILGGPDFPLDPEQKLQYFQKNQYVDARVLFEGEVSFSDIIDRVLKYGVYSKSKIFHEPIDGCAFINKEKDRLIEGQPTRIEDLNQIPSPYTTGLLDEFFDGKLVPIIQTSRGCPYKCNYCVEADNYYSKIKSFNVSSVEDELEYIGEKITQTSKINMLHIADSNFGMYRNDTLISEKISDLQCRYSWPQAIAVSTGKKFDNVLKTTDKLMHTFDFSLSVQSMNKNTLEEIGRKNISPEKYKIVGEDLRRRGHTTLSETIVPLPRETLESFYDGMIELMDWKVSRIITNTVMILSGTVYKNDFYLGKYGYDARFRLLSNQFGVYEGRKIFESEEVGVATNTLSFEDYLETRRFSFLVEMLFNSKIFYEIELLLEDFSLKYSEFVLYAYEKLRCASPEIVSLMESLVSDSVHELKDTEEDIWKYYGEENVFSNLMAGNEGANIKYKYKALLLSDHKSDWLDFVFECLDGFLLSKNYSSGLNVNNVSKFIQAKFHGVLDHATTNQVLVKDFNYDVISWLTQSGKRRPLSEYLCTDPVKIKFLYDDSQISSRDYLFDHYDSGGAVCVVSVLVNIRPQHKLFRKFDYA